MSTKRKRRYKVHFSNLRDLINSWDLIADSPSDEFDSINHLCLSLLHKGADKLKLGKSIHHELTTNYGLSMDEVDSDTLAKEVIEWWVKNK